MYDYIEPEYEDCIASLVIYNFGTIENCYTRGKVKEYGSNNIIGAIISYAENYGNIKNTYYLSGTSKYVINREMSTSASLMEKAEQELKGLSSMLGSMWTTSTNINNGYPILTWQK